MLDPLSIMTEKTSKIKINVMLSYEVQINKEIF